MVSSLIFHLLEAIQRFSDLSESTIREHIGICLKYTPDRVGGSGRDGQKGMVRGEAVIGVGVGVATVEMERKEATKEVSPKRRRAISSSDEE